MENRSSSSSSSSNLIVGVCSVHIGRDSYTYEPVSNICPFCLLLVLLSICDMLLLAITSYLYAVFQLFTFAMWSAVLLLEAELLFVITLGTPGGFFRHISGKNVPNLGERKYVSRTWKWWSIKIEGVKMQDTAWQIKWLWIVPSQKKFVPKIIFSIPPDAEKFAKFKVLLFFKSDKKIMARIFEWEGHTSNAKRVSGLSLAWMGGCPLPSPFQ